MRNFDDCFGIAVQAHTPSYREMLLPEFGGENSRLLTVVMMDRIIRTTGGETLSVADLDSPAEAVVYAVGGDSGHTKTFRPAPQKEYAIRGGKLVDDNPRNGGKGKATRAKTRKTAPLPGWLQRHPTRGVSATQARLDAMREFYNNSEFFDDDFDGPSFEGGEKYTPPAGDTDYESIRRGSLSAVPQQSFGGSRDVGDGV